MNRSLEQANAQLAANNVQLNDPDQKILVGSMNDTGTFQDSCMSPPISPKMTPTQRTLINANTEVV